MSDIVERLRSSQPLPICPFDKKSPDYYTTPNDKPCKFCGGEPEGPDRCTGADTRIMGEAASEITRLRQLLSKAETREWETLTQLSELAEKEAEELMDKWISDQGATVDTKAAGVASHIVNDFRGHIEGALIKLERRAALERSEG